MPARTTEERLSAVHYLAYSETGSLWKQKPHYVRQRQPDTLHSDLGEDASIAHRIATSDEADDVIDDGKDPAAKALGAKGGKKRAENMTPERRAEIAKKAAESRWRK